MKSYNYPIKWQHLIEKTIKGKTQFIIVKLSEIHRNDETYIEMMKARNIQDF